VLTLHHLAAQARMAQVAARVYMEVKADLEVAGAHHLLIQVITAGLAVAVVVAAVQQPATAVLAVAVAVAIAELAVQAQWFYFGRRVIR
jgi:zinc transporter ZupT